MRRRRGFTLVELMIVVLILGALAAIAIPRIIGGAVQARANACATQIAVMNTQIELFNAQTSAWPGTLSAVTGLATYFPDGAPICPFAVAYSDTLLATNRVDETGHGH